MRNFVNTVKRNGSGHSGCNEIESAYSAYRDDGGASEGNGFFYYSLPPVIHIHLVDNSPTPNATTSHCTLLR